MLNVWDSKGVFFVIRHKANLKYEVITERELPEKASQHVLKDEEITLSNPTSKHKYPNKLRRVALWDDVNNQTIEVITNNFNWTAQTIGLLYNYQHKGFYFPKFTSNHQTANKYSLNLKPQNYLGQH